MEDTIFDRRESRVRSYCRGVPATFTSASGSVLTDSDGREYLDFLAGAGALNYGHNDPDMKAALLDYVSRDGVAHSLDYHTAAKADFLEAFESLILAPRGLDHLVQFTGPTGTNAVEAALKLARKITGRTNVIAFTNGFHGCSSGALAATANSHHRVGPEQALSGVTRMPYDGYLGPHVDTADYLERVLNDPSGGVDAPAAVLLELVQGEGGLNAASAGWFRRVADIARRHGALVIVDDIQAGCGRAGGFFSFEGMGVTPDLITLSKSLSGYGLPLAVLLVRPELDQWLPGQHNGTFRGNNHAFVTATAALRTYWSDGRLSDDVQRRARLVTSALQAMAEQVPGARVKGRGLMQGLDVVRGDLASAVRARCLEGGVILECVGPHDEVLKVMPPLTISDAQLLRGLEVLGESVAACDLVATLC